MNTGYWLDVAIEVLRGLGAVAGAIAGGLSLHDARTRRRNGEHPPPAAAVEPNLQR